MSPYSFPPVFWVTGTDTDVGKTLVSAILTYMLRADYWKPVQCGIIEGTDLDFIRRLTGLEEKHFHSETHLFAAPLSPHLAAEMEGKRIELADFQIPVTNNKHLIIEGAGGLLVPLNEDALLIDLMDQTKLPVVIVARSGLGTINHTLLSIQALRTKGIEILGVILNGPKNQKNKEAIEHYGQVKVIFELDQLPLVNRETMEQTIEQWKEQ